MPRTRQIEIEIPEQQFTTRDLAERNALYSEYTIHRRLHEWLATGKVRRIGEKYMGIGKRYKRHYLYERVAPRTGGATTSAGRPLHPATAA